MVALLAWRRAPRISRTCRRSPRAALVALLRVNSRDRLLVRLLARLLRPPRLLARLRVLARSKARRLGLMAAPCPLRGLTSAVVGLITRTWNTAAVVAKGALRKSRNTARKHPDKLGGGQMSAAFFV